MKLKLLLLTALTCLGSTASAFTLHNCKSIDTNLNQTLKVSEIFSRNPNKNGQFSVMLLEGDTLSTKFIMKPEGIKTSGSITVNSFTAADSQAELKIITKNPNLVPFGGGGGSLDYPLDKFCGRAPCLPGGGSRHPVKFPDEVILKITTIAVLVNDGLTTTYQCND